MALIIGTDGSDVLTGTPEADLFRPLGGTDTLVDFSPYRPDVSIPLVSSGLYAPGEAFHLNGFYIADPGQGYLSGVPGGWYDKEIRITASYEGQTVYSLVTTVGDRVFDTGGLRADHLSVQYAEIDRFAGWITHAAPIENLHVGLGQGDQIELPAGVDPAVLLASAAPDGHGGTMLQASGTTLILPGIDPGSVSPGWFLPAASSRDIVLSLSEDAWNGDAVFAASLDGASPGDPQAVTALRACGAVQGFALGSVSGDGIHTVSVDFLNDAYGGSYATDRNLYVESIRLGDVTYVTDTILASNGGRDFAVGGVAQPGQQTLSLRLSGDAWEGQPDFAIRVDGKLLGASQTVSAVHGQGGEQEFTYIGGFGAGPHTVSVTFLNDAYGGTPETDRNLHVESIAFEGQVTEFQSVLLGNGTLDFQIG